MICFSFSYSLQLSSTLSLISSSFDAPGLEQYLICGDNTPPATSHVVRNQAELDTVPSDVEELWIGRFDTMVERDYSFNSFQSLKSLVIAKNVFWEVTSLKFWNLPFLQSIEIGNNCFFNVSLLLLTGLID